MDRNRNEADVFFIPPNFIEGGTVFGGSLRLRNVLEGGILVAASGLPVLGMPFSLTMRIIVLCLTALPLGIVAVIGISGESLSSFAVNFCKYLRNRRVVGVEKNQKKADREKKRPRAKQEDIPQKPAGEKRKPRQKWKGKQEGLEEYDEEFR